MKVVAIIQARMASTRLPGKVLADIGGRSMLARVCRRVQRATTVDRLVVAATDRPGDGPIVDRCRQLGIACFRGSEPDVLDRYHKAAKAHAADVVVRITSDCPLIDPEVIDQVVREKGDITDFRGHNREKSVMSPFLSAADYASNTIERTWPRGLDTEVMTADALRRAAREATEPYQREHVTPYIYQHPEKFRLLSVTAEENHGHERWTVDTPEDLEFVRTVYRELGGGETFSWHDVRDLLARKPQLAEINRHVRQKQLAEA